MFYLSEFISEIAFSNFVIILALIVFSVWVTIFILEKASGVKMSIWSGIGYVIGIFVFVVILFIPISALIGDSEISGLPYYILNIIITVVYSLLAGFMFFHQYKSGDDSTEKQKGSEEEVN